MPRYVVWGVLAIAVIAAALGLRSLRRSAPDVGGPDAAAVPPAPTTTMDIRSVWYDLALRVHPGLTPPPERPRAGGAIAAWRDAFMLVTAIGEFYRVSWDGDALRSERLPFDLPFNRTDLIQQSGGGAGAPFRIMDLLVEDDGASTRVLVAHHHWHPEGHCVAIRVSSVIVAASGRPAGGWSPVYDTTPCLSVGRHWPMGQLADRSGGRLARHADGLLLTVGDHGFDGLEDLPMYPQDPSVSYGKVMMIAGDGTAVPFSLGHRNAQGLAVDDRGRVWSTEHGPEGGDELNLVARGGNYGWPLATYGTAANNETWPLAVNPHDHGNFREPVMAFVPALGISQLLQVRGDYLARWTGDLLIGSLQAGALMRARVAGDRVIYAEHMDVGMRVRDLAEGRDGRILIWNDSGEVASLTLDGD